MTIVILIINTTAGKAGNTTRAIPAEQYKTAKQATTLTRTNEERDYLRIHVLEAGIANSVVTALLGRDILH